MIYENGSEFLVVDQTTGESVPPNSGGEFINHMDGSQTRVAVPTGDPPCDCFETAMVALAGANAPAPSAKKTAIVQDVAPTHDEPWSK